MSASTSSIQTLTMSRVLATLRIRKSITRAELAAGSGLTYATVHAVEVARRGVTMDTLTALAYALGHTLTAVMGVYEDTVRQIIQLTGEEAPLSEFLRALDTVMPPLPEPQNQPANCDAPGCGLRAAVKGLCTRHYHRQRYRVETGAAPHRRENIVMGSCLRAYRLRQKKTQAEVAAAAGVTKKVIAAVERGRNCRHETWSQVQQALGVDAAAVTALYNDVFRSFEGPQYYMAHAPVSLETDNDRTANGWRLYSRLEVRKRITAGA